MSPRMDNLAAHKVPGVIDAIEARGAKAIFLPPHHIAAIRRHYVYVEISDLEYS